MRGLDDYLSNAPGVNQEEREINVTVKCDKEDCPRFEQEQEVEALFVTDGVPTSGSLYWTCACGDKTDDCYEYEG